MGFNSDATMQTTDFSKEINYKYGLIRKSRIGDAKLLATRLRKEDADEIRYYYDRDIDFIIEESVKNSKACFSFVSNNGSIEIMFGVGWTQNPRVGLIWLLSSEFIYSVKHIFLRENKKYIDFFLKGHDLLTNHVHSKNNLSMRWLEWLGFEKTKYLNEFGKHKENFVEFCYFSSDESREVYLKRNWPHY